MLFIFSSINKSHSRTMNVGAGMIHTPSIVSKSSFPTSQLFISETTKPNANCIISSNIYEVLYSETTRETIFIKFNRKQLKNICLKDFQNLNI